MSILVERVEADANYAGMGRWSPWSGSFATGGPLRFEDIYRERLRYVWHVLRRLGVPPREREDVAQEVFLAVHRSLPTFDSTRPILPWIHGIAFHVTKSHQRQRRQEVLMDDTDDFDPIDPGDDPEEKTAVGQARAIVIRLMQTIDLDRRVVLSMHDFDGVGMKDIVHELGITLSAGYKRLETARGELEAAAKRLTAQERHAMGAHGAAPIGLATLLEADRIIPDAPADVRDRLWGRLQRALSLGGAGATAALAPTGAPSLAARVAAMTAPRVAPFLVGVAVGAGALLALKPHTPAPRDAAAPVVLAREAGPAPAQVATAAPAGPGGSGAPAAAAGTAAPAAAAGTAAPAGAGTDAGTAPTAGSRIEDEGDLILQARAALAAGQLPAALAALDKHQRLYPTGRLAETRDELRAQVIERRRAAGASSAPAPAPPPPPSNRLFGTEEDR